MYLPETFATSWFYRAQMRVLEGSDRVTHIISQTQSCLLRRRHRTPTVITCYDLFLPWSLRSLPWAERVIVPSRHVRDELSERISLPHDPEVIPLAVPPNYRAMDAPRRHDQILYVGSEQTRKNVDGLFRIFARVLRGTRATLVKVGGASEARPSLVRLAEQLGIREQVVWKDFASEDELVDLYRTSTVTVVPSFREGFSMPCLEAMSCGCPLIASNRTSIPETVASGGLLLDPTDETAWAEAILRVLRDPAAARDLSRRGIERSRAFSAEESASRTLRVYEDLWAHRGG